MFYHITATANPEMHMSPHHSGVVFDTPPPPPIKWDDISHKQVSFIKMGKENIKDIL